MITRTPLTSVLFLSFFKCALPSGFSFETRARVFGHVVFLHFFFWGRVAPFTSAGLAFSIQHGYSGGGGVSRVSLDPISLRQHVPFLCMAKIQGRTFASRAMRCFPPFPPVRFRPV